MKPHSLDYKTYAMIYNNDNIDDSILFNYSGSNNSLIIDSTFLDSEEKAFSEKEKYGLAANEKIGLVIIGTVNGNSKITYTTVLSSERFLLFCGVNKNYDIEWSKIRSVSRLGISIVFELKDGTEKKFHGGFLGNGIGITNNALINNINFFISLINNKIP